ncbi:threonine-phosphate decarboxylase CobD [bacterium]|nr:threonine-phosphate decarboxylase CobD [bacterium]MBU0899559.1 threonine-phosphate decarboxylase CobD [bacterium]MBU1152667.1 threonine-phosphate decarboxylase CobD [bacterium]MBU1782464.1 threonine-phosphate decarboxylase CobD [bacterium]MBU2600409.1 threonine-phosphate decarboxylase CobD [bacterium]
MFHGGNIWAYAKKYNLEPEKILDFSANVNNFKDQKQIRKIILRNISKISCYPDLKQHDLKEIVAERNKLDNENVVLGNGSIELIYLISKYLSPCQVKIVVPTFGEYEEALKIFGSKISYFKTLEKDNFDLNIDLLLDNLRDEKVLFICNPNNPTGRLIKDNHLLRLIEGLKKRKIFLVIDEAFLDFCQDKIDLNFRRELVKEGDVFLIRSLTKVYGLAGLRLGYALVGNELSKQLNQMLPPWNVNCLAYEVALGILKDKEADEKIREKVNREKRFLVSRLSKLRYLKIFDSQTNFILIKLLANTLNVEKIEEELIKSKILIRNSQSFHLESNNYFRIAVKAHHQNKFFIQKLQEILGMG